MRIRRRGLVLVFAVAGTLGASDPARALLAPGQTVTDFSRHELVGSSTGPLRTLGDYAGKILVMYQFGYNCPVCIVDAPNFQTQFVQHYQSTAPGYVQVVGADMWNGTNGAVVTYRNQSGATYPLLLLAGTADPGNLNGWGPWDNYVIASADGVVRFNAAAQGYAHGSRLDIPRMKALVDSLLATTVGVPGSSPPITVPTLAVAPNPFSGATRIVFEAPAFAGERASVTLHDVAGRRVTTLFDGTIPGGRASFGWDGMNAAGSTAPAGVYLVVGRVANRTFHTRLVKLR